MTTGITDVDWLDAKVCELSAENERLREELLRFAKFAEDAPGLDYNEDRVLSWISVNVERARKLAAARGGE